MPEKAVLNKILRQKLSLIIRDGKVLIHQSCYVVVIKGMEIEVPGIKLGEKFDCICGKTHEIRIMKAVLGENEICTLQKLLDELNLSGLAVLVEDEITKNIAGNRIARLLKEAGINVIEYVASRPTIHEVNNLQQLCSKYKPKFSLAVGGGSVIDVCKLASHRSGIPFISIPTTLSHDGSVSATSSLISEEGKKESYPSSPPIAVIFDLEILKTQPKRFIAAGCGDMLGKATSLKDWELGRDEKNEYYCPIAATMAKTTYDETVDFIKGGGKDLVMFSKTIFKSGLAMVIAGSSRPNSGSEHIISHYIDVNTQKPAMHGEQVGFASILMSVYHMMHNENWWSEEKFQWYYIKEMLERMDLPTTTKDLNIKLDVVIGALVDSYKLRPNRYTILHKRPMNKEEAFLLLKKIGAINN